MRWLITLEIDHRVLINHFMAFQVAEDRRGTSLGCHWVCRWRRRWIAPTTLAPRTSTSFQWRGSRGGWTGCLRLVLETWLWPPSRRESPISVRRCCRPSSSVSASHGAERTEYSCTSKVLHFLSPLIDVFFITLLFSNDFLFVRFVLQIMPVLSWIQKVKWKVWTVKFTYGTSLDSV